MALKLKRLLNERSVSANGLARATGLNSGSMSRLLNFGVWPKTPPEDELRRLIGRHLGMPVEQLVSYFDHDVDLQGQVDQSSPAAEAVNQPEIDIMLLRKQTLTREARQHFRIARDPFDESAVQSDADVFVTDDIRHVRAAMRQTARHGGLLAVISESGGGKSTLRHDLVDWINSNNEPITVIQPFVLGMEGRGERGKTLTSIDITGAVIRKVAPGTTLRASQQDRYDQMHAVLSASAQVGRKHVLVIEEAHDLAVPTIKHLKRFYELQDGFRRLISVILIGQTELERKLSEQNPEVREVVQRMEIVTLPPLDSHLEGYLRHKLGRADVSLDAVLDPAAVDEIRAQLRTTITERGNGQRATRMASLCYPLAVHNLLTAAMNAAVRIGAPRVTADLVAAAARAS
ncbi:AAA family ATPase [Caldimonas sp. KR1-144]|uniref:AAA family ATPase n=1 Tax=Caldimonas sp. KR1-144 TaxID=3400911 RepID=UPI003C123346